MNKYLQAWTSDNKQDKTVKVNSDLQNSSQYPGETQTMFVQREGEKEGFVNYDDEAHISSSSNGISNLASVASLARVQ